jgi:hypothetical protein
MHLSSSCAKAWEWFAHEGAFCPLINLPPAPFSFMELCTCCRSLRNKYVKLERALEAAQRAQQHDAELAAEHAAAAERAQARLREATAKQAELAEQLL